MPASPIKLPFPLGGLTTNMSYESGDIQSTPDCLNVVPESSEESRTRGGSRPGFGKRYNTQLSGTARFSVRVSGGDNTRVYEYMVIGTQDNIYIGQSIADSSSAPITYTESLSPLSGNLITEAGDNIELETSTDVLIVFDFNVDISQDGIATNYRDVVIIGGDGDYLEGNTKVFGSSSGGELGTLSYTSSEVRLDDINITNWNNENIDDTVHYVEILSGAGVTLGTYQIDSIDPSGGHIVLVSSASIGTGSVTYSIRDAARSLNPNTPSINVLVPTGGFVPLAADEVTSYRDRLVWAKNRTWYMSRQGDPGDYDFGADPEDPSRAVAGTTAGPGEPADPIIAMAPGGYDYLVMFSESAVWVMRGDPAFGGQLYQASGVAGCIARDAWCYGDSTEIYFLGKDGLYMMEPNAGAIRPLSQGKLPRSLRGVDRDNFNVCLVYDPEDKGVLVFIVPVSGSEGTHYYYDIGTSSFWPLKITVNSQQPKFATTFGGSPARPRRAVIVSRDGYVREFGSLAGDDGSAISSSVILGPYQVNESGVDAILSELVAVVDEQSQSVRFDVYGGNTAEEATANAKGSITTGGHYGFSLAGGGRSYSSRPRLRCNAFCVKIQASGPWAFESLSGMIAPAGKYRRH
jgi:hypothetical protein